MRIVYHCEDVVGARMAGPGIRAVELARRLAARHEVTLVAAGAETLSGEPFRSGNLSALAFADAFVTQGFGFPVTKLARFRGRLVLDLYDPVQLEQLARYGPNASDDERVGLVVLRHRLQMLIRRADHVLCASAPQRALWLGWLGAVGRLNPEALDGDPEARRLLAVVPFGLPEAPPTRAGSPLRESIGAAADDRVALWTGGLWDWMDPALAVRAAGLVQKRLPRFRLALLAGSRPGNPDMRMTAAASEARAAASEAHAAAASEPRSARGEGIHFIDRWIDYADRGAWLLDADLAVSAHKPSLEAELAFRSRLLDCLWASLPVACTAGDVLAAEGERQGWARLAPAGDAQALAEALLAFCDPAKNERARAAAREVAARRTWQASADVLLDLLERSSPPRQQMSRTPALAAAFARKAMRKLRR
jgi:glycosyltransferase involved in cell wall biosynthesis